MLIENIIFAKRKYQRENKYFKLILMCLKNNKLRLAVIYLTSYILQLDTDNMLKI